MSSHGAARAGLSTADRLRRLAMLAGAVVGLVLITGTAAFWATGGRWFVVRTPSMGTAAPVGSLVLTRPTTIADLHLGDVVAYHPPDGSSTTFTHRIVAISAAGVRTRGDINGATDPWLISQSEIVGRVTVVPAAGWVFRALPLLLVGGLVVWGLTALWAPIAWRGPLRMAGSAVLFSLSVATLKPFVNVTQLEVQQKANGAHVVAASTGLLPVRLTAAPGHGHAKPVDLNRAGQVGVSHFTGGRPGERYQLAAHLHLMSWQWLIVALFCASPLLWTLLVGFRADPDTVTARHAAAPAAATS